MIWVVKLKIALDRTKLSNLLILVAIVGILFFISMVAIAVGMGIDIGALLSMFIEGTFGSAFGILSILRVTTGLVVVSLGLAVAFRVGVLNVGGDGQMLWGALATMAVALHLDLPAPLMIILIFILSFLAGGGWGLIAGFLKAKWGVHELVSTLMLNFVAIATMIEISSGPWQDPVVLIAMTKMIPESIRFPFISYPLNAVFIISLALIPVVYILMNRTVLGYKIKVVGSNIHAAENAGMSNKKIIMLCMFISGGICALSGSLLVLGQYFRAEANMTGKFGFYGIVAAVLGKCRPELMLVTSFILAFFITGTNSLRVLGVSGGFVDVIMGILFIVGVLPDLLARVRRR